MAIGNYIKANKASPFYILHVLTNYSSPEHPLSVMDIKRILSEYPYDMPLDRETITSGLKELKAYFDDEIGNSISDQEGTSGYTYKWYYNRSNNLYTEINEMLNEMIHYSSIPETYSKKLSEKVKGIFPPVQKIDDDELTSSNYYFAKQHEMSKETYQTFKQIVNIIKENKLSKDKETLIRFNFNQYYIKGKKVKLNSEENKSYEVLPLAIVENDYQYWLIAYYEYTPTNNVNITFKLDGSGIESNENQKEEKVNKTLPENKQLKHFRIDLITNIKTIKKEKTRDDDKRKLIAQVTSKDALDKYLSEHIFVAFNEVGKKENLLSDYDEIVSAQLKASYDYGSITYLVDILGKDINIIETSPNDCIIKIRCSKSSILELVERHFDKIEVLSPESLRIETSKILQRKVSSILDKLYDYPYTEVKEKYYSIYRKVNRNKTYFCIEINNVHGGFEINENKINKLNASSRKFENYLKKNDFTYELIYKNDGTSKDVYAYVTDKFNKKEELIDFINQYKQDNIFIFYDIYQFKHNPNPNDKQKIGKFKIAKRSRYPENKEGGLINFMNKLEGNL